MALVPQPARLNRQKRVTFLKKAILIWGIPLRVHGREIIIQLKSMYQIYKI